MLCLQRWDGVGRTVVVDELSPGASVGVAGSVSNSIVFENVLIVVGEVIVQAEEIGAGITESHDSG